MLGIQPYLIFHCGTTTSQNVQVVISICKFDQMDAGMTKNGTTIPMMRFVKESRHVNFVTQAIVQQANKGIIVKGMKTWGGVGKQTLVAWVVPIMIVALIDTRSLVQAMGNFDQGKLYIQTQPHSTHALPAL